MADTLRYLAEARSLIPDNAQNLVSPQDVREYLLALEPDRGGYTRPGSAGAATISLTANVWAELNSVTVPGIVPYANPVRWGNDANARPFPSWGPDVTVPPGHKRFLVATGLIAADPVLQNDDDFELALSINGTPLEDQAERFKITENGEIASVTLIAGTQLLMDGSEYVALAIRNLDASRDINLYSIDFVCESSAYEEAPI